MPFLRAAVVKTYRVDILRVSTPTGTASTNNTNAHPRSAQLPGFRAVQHEGGRDTKSANAADSRNADMMKAAHRQSARWRETQRAVDVAVFKDTSP